MTGEDAHRRGRLLARPAKDATGTAPSGLRLLGAGSARGGAHGYLYVPTGPRDGRLAPLVVLLHGAGEDARDGLALLRAQADEFGLILLALTSRGPTWDFVVGGYGPESPPSTGR